MSPSKKVDVVICLSHGGVQRGKDGQFSDGDDLRVVKAVPGIDVVIGGHSCAASCVLAAPPSPGRATKHSYSQVTSTVCVLAANPLEPFAMWPAFPASDYYGSSAPPPRHQPTTCLPSCPAGCRIRSGPQWRFPCSLSTDRRVRCPAMPLRPRHGYAADLHRDLPNRRHQPAREFPAIRAGARRCPAHIRQVGAGACLLRGVQPLVPRVHLPVSLAGPDPSGSTRPSRRCRGCFPPAWVAQSTRGANAARPFFGCRNGAAHRR
jgi:hypothetical protein